MSKWRHSQEISLKRKAIDTNFVECSIKHERETDTVATEGMIR